MKKMKVRCQNFAFHFFRTFGIHISANGKGNKDKKGATVKLLMNNQTFMSDDHTGKFDSFTREYTNFR